MVAGYRISTDQSELDFEVIYTFIASSYWAAGIPRDTLKKAIANSLCFAILTEAGAQVGFARLITDKATFAYLADVFVLEAHRGKGLSKWLMKHILAHPELRGVRRTLLATRDAHALYAQYGFTPVPNPESMMQVWRPEIYQKQAGE